MLLYYSNHFDDATLTPGTDSEDVDFPVENAQQEHLSRRWKSKGVNASETLEIDLGSALDCTKLIISGHNLTSADVVQIEGYNDAGFVTRKAYTPANTITAGASYGVTILPDAGGTTTCRYWKLYVSKSSAANIAQIGRIYLGPVVDTTERGSPDFEGYSQTHQDLSKVEKALGGERYANRRSRFRDINLRISYVPESIQALFRALDAAVGIATPFWLQVHATSPLADFLYVAQTKPLSEAVTAWDSAPIWNTALNLEELI